MNKYIIFFVSLLMLTTACVDDFQDAQPPRLLDAPSVFSASITNTLLSGGESTSITLNVVDAPAGISAANIIDTDFLGQPAGGTFSLVSGSGIESGDVVVEYTAPQGFAGTVNLAVSVSDSQVNDKGDDASKSSVARLFSVSVVCGTLSGGYAAVGTILVDDFGSGPYNYDEAVSLFECDIENEYAISDISGGLWANDYAEAYGTSAIAAVLLVDGSNNVTWTGVSDQFGGTIIQDAAQPASSYDPGTGTFTINWTATAYGERGVLTLTK